VKAADLREMSIDELQAREHELYREIYELRNKLQQEAGPLLKDYRNLRRELAQVKTVINEKRKAH